MSKYFDLEKHLEQEHKISPLATYLKEIVYGGNDGIVTTFAVVAGFAGAQTDAGNLPILSVLLFGFANLFADGASMALGNFLSTRSEQDVYRTHKRKEASEIKADPQTETLESIEILVRKGFSEKQARDLVAIYQTNPAYWLEFMMRDELELSSPEGDNPYLTALVTFFSFILFGLIPLLPYILWRHHPQVFFMSCAATLSAMLLLGTTRALVSKQKLVRPLLENLSLGSLAAVIAYFVGSLFRI